MLNPYGYTTRSLACQQMKVQWRTGMLNVMAYALFLSVVAIVLGRWLVISLDKQVSEQRKALFGADRVIVSSEPIKLSQAVTQLPLRRSRSVIFHTMAFANGKMQLLRVRATDRHFPLLGHWEHHGEKPLQSGQIYLQESAQKQLNLSLDQPIEIGAKELHYAGLSVREPSTGSRSFWLVPKAVMSLSDLKATQVIVPGSRLQYIESFAGKALALNQLDQLLTDPPKQWRYLKRSQYAQQTTQWLAQARLPMSISVVLIVLFCFYTQLIAVRGYMHQQRSLLSVCRACGGSPSRERGLLLWPLLITLLSATLVGICVAILIYKFTLWFGPSWLVFRPAHWWSLIWAVLPLLFIVGLVIAMQRHMQHWSIRQLMSQPLPLRAPLLYWIIFSLIAIILLVNNWLWAMILIAGILASLVFVALTRRLIVFLLQYLQHYSLWRLVVMQLRRTHSSRDSLILGLMLSIGLTAALWGTQHQLLERWVDQLPPDTPNYFLINITPNKIPALRQLAQQHQVKLSAQFKMIRGRLTAINQQALCEQNCAPNEPKAMRRELNFTQSSTLPADNKIIQGQWFKASQTPSISVAERFAQDMNIKVGDQLTFTLYGEPITLPVTSIRRVNWRSFQPNFFVIFNPGALKSYPGTMIASAYIPQHGQQFIQQMRQQDPGFSAIDIQQIVSDLQTVLKQLVIALQSVSLLLLVAALLLLNAQLRFSLFERRQQVSVWRLLGMQRQSLRWALLLEFIVVGFISSVLALGLSQVMLWQLAQQLSLPWSLDITMTIIVILIGPVLACLAVWRYIEQLVGQRQWLRWGRFG